MEKNKNSTALIEHAEYEMRGRTIYEGSFLDTVCKIIDRLKKAEDRLKRCEPILGAAFNAVIKEEIVEQAEALLNEIEAEENELKADI